jgi:hypothetical protein
MSQVEIPRSTGGRPFGDDIRRAMEFLSHDPTRMYTAVEISERIGPHNHKQLLQSLLLTSQRGTTGLRKYNEEGQGHLNYYYWYNPEVTPIPYSSNSTEKEKQVTTESNSKATATRGITKLVTFHLADHPNQTFTSKQIADEFGVDIKVASNALNAAAARVPEIKRLSRGVYRWIGHDTPASEEAPEPEPTPPTTPETPFIPATANRLMFKQVSEKDGNRLVIDSDGVLWKMERVDW